ILDREIGDCGRGNVVAVVLTAGGIEPHPLGDRRNRIRPDQKEHVVARRCPGGIKRRSYDHVLPANIADRQLDKSLMLVESVRGGSWRDQAGGADICRVRGANGLVGVVAQSVWRPADLRPRCQVAVGIEEIPRGIDTGVLTIRVWKISTG